MARCERCHKETRATIMSMFDDKMICMDCSDLERKDSRYEEARKSDEDAIKNGNFNFKGIGY